jgi:hypothetical protein
VEILEAQSQHGVYYRWGFSIEEGEFKGRTVYANVSDKFGPQSKARRWSEQMIGRPIKKGERFDTNVLLNKNFHITVSNTPEDERGRVYDNVENVHRVRPKANEESDERTDAPKEEEYEFDNIP